jgi:hypothetical protein
LGTQITLFSGVGTQDPNSTCPCPTLKTDIKFVSALNKKIISNACLWRLIRRLSEVFFLFGEFLPIGDPKK